MTRLPLSGGVRALRLLAASTASTFLSAGCSSMHTGTPSDDAAERACLDTCEAIARAGERCGLEYKRLYDTAVRDHANGDCKNVVSIRDEGALRNRCFPALRSERCADIVLGQYDASCSTQLQRTASIVPPLFAPGYR